MRRYSIAVCTTSQQEYDSMELFPKEVFFRALMDRYHAYINIHILCPVDRGFPKIAVFCASTRQYYNIKFMPKEMFIRVRDIRDIYQSFSAVIILPHFYDAPNNIMNAYERLQLMQPQLFEAT